jgi:hypothetical protein
MKKFLEQNNGASKVVLVLISILDSPTPSSTFDLSTRISARIPYVRCMQTPSNMTDMTMCVFFFERT